MDADKLRTGSGSWRIISVRQTVWRPGAMRYACTIGVRYDLTMLCGAQSRMGRASSLDHRVLCETGVVQARIALAARRSPYSIASIILAH